MPSDFLNFCPRGSKNFQWVLHHVQGQQCEGWIWQNHGSQWFFTEALDTTNDNTFLAISRLHANYVVPSTTDDNSSCGDKDDAYNSSIGLTSISFVEENVLTRELSHKFFQSKLIKNFTY